MAKEFKKSSEKEVNKVEVKESSANKLKTPSKPAGSVQPGSQSNGTPAKLDSNLGKVPSTNIETYNLVEGRQDYDGSVTVIDNVDHLNLPVPNVAANTTPQQNREGGVILREFSTFSKIYKPKIANTVKGGHHGIAEMPSYPVGEAMDRATGDTLKVDNGHRDIVFPDAVNFLVGFNVSGHIPKPFISKVTEWREDRVNGLVVEEVEAENVKGLKKLTVPVAPTIGYNADIYEECEDANALISSRPNGAYNIQHANFGLSLNRAELQSAYNNAFNMDIDTHNYFTDFTKVLRNLNEINDTKLDNIPTIMKSEEFVYSKILGDIDFATWLYILIDSWACNLDYVNFLGEKFGIVDNTIRSMFLGHAQDRRILSSRLSNVMAVFDNIPVNSRVIDEWNRVKLASKIGNPDDYAEGNMLVIPHFFPLFAFVDSPSGPEHSLVSASANTTAIRVPLDSLLHASLSNNRQLFQSGVSSYRQADAFVGRRGSVAPYTGHQLASNVHNLAISAVRMTAESANLLRNMMTGEFWANISSYFVRNVRYYNLLNTSGTYNGTSFKFGKPRTPDLAFRNVEQPKFCDSFVHVPYLMTVNSYLDGADLAPALITENVPDDLAFLRNFRHYIVFDKYSRKAHIQKHLKAFVVNSHNAENENGNVTVDNDINANLETIVLSSSIIIPYLDTSGHHFSMNITPVVRCNTMTFTHQINQICHETPMLFEFFGWASERNTRLNSDLHEPHVAGIDLAHNDYLVAESFHPFCVNASDKAMYSLFQNWSVPFPKPQFYAEALDQTMNVAGAYGYDYPVVNSYMPHWTYKPFADHSANDVLGFNGKYLTFDDLLINNSK